MINNIAVVALNDGIIKPTPAAISSTPVRYTKKSFAGINSGIIITIPFWNLKCERPVKMMNTAIPRFPANKKSQTPYTNFVPSRAVKKAVKRISNNFINLPLVCPDSNC